MNKHVEKALMLLDRRPKLAAKEVMTALEQTPDDPYLHALLALCQVNSGDKQGAFQEVKIAIQLDPEYPFAFYVLAKCHYDDNNMLEAEVAIDEALRLEPFNSTYWGLLSNVQIEQGELKEALISAENGLEMSPEDTHCHNLRAFLNMKLGKKEEAQLSLDTAMAQDPEDPLTHAYRGWVLIEQNNYADSMHHFREALRLDPTLDWARQGLIKALQVRHPLYQIQLKLKKVGAVGVFLGILGLMFIMSINYTSSSAETMHLIALGKFIGSAVIVAFILMFILTSALPSALFLDPIIRFLLVFDSDGRLAMTPEERFFNVHLVSFIFAGLIGLVYGCTTSSMWVLALIVFAYFSSFPLTRPPEKRDKKLWIQMGACAVFFGAIAAFFTIPMAGTALIRTVIAFNVTKALLSAGGAKALLGAIGLGATATALKEKEKKKIRERMLNQDNNQGKTTK